ncbi:winged helix-turn-helix transcriptional regulator [Variovorax sp. RCC_210]|uniref:winged helix-turn-helix transcriptional regulator n=1 Tax=Variovorax sp. RCC_210 TaxID=3239217 RepID=UPI003525D97D
MTKMPKNSSTQRELAFPSSSQTLCPIARVQDVVGDRWTVLVLRELFLGNRRFEEIQIQTQATPQMVASRLKKLESDGLVERRIYSQRPPRHEYCLTEMGVAFHPVFLALRAWGETWFKSNDEEVAIQYIHVPCGQDPGLGPDCRSCAKVMRRGELSAKLSAPYGAERQARLDAFKGR